MIRVSNARSSGISSLAVPMRTSADTAFHSEMHHIYSGWALYFFTRDPEKTEYCFSRCLELNPFDANSLYLRSVSKRDVARFESALRDALSAARFNKHKPSYDFEVCECYGSLKQFEKSKSELHNKLRKYLGQNAKRFKHGIEVIDQYLNNCLGPALVIFIKKHKKQFPEVLEAIKRESAQDPRPRWKILKELEKCDVISVEEKEKELISPLEKARRERWYRIFNQIYFGRNWVDKAFLRDLAKSEKYLPPIFTESTPVLKELIRPQNEAVKKFVKILHARSPLYREQYKRFGNEKFAKRHTESYLFEQQYQARRKMFNALRALKEYREKGNIEAMCKYVEELMGDYVTTKTNRIMPRKFEFINEVYNLLALAHVDWYLNARSNRRLSEQVSNRLQKLLGIVIEEKQKTNFVFGDRSTYIPPDAVDPSLDKYKNFLERMEQRLYFAKYPIEKVYLWFEIARAHYKRKNFGECNLAAKHSEEASKICNNLLWRFLAQMLRVKCFAAQYKVEYCQEILSELDVTVRALKNDNLQNFVEVAVSMTTEEITHKQSFSSMELVRRHSSHSRARSLGSQTQSLMTLKTYHSLSSEDEEDKDTVKNDEEYQQKSL